MKYLFLLMVALGSCAPAVTTFMDKDADVDVRQFKTFSWQRSPSAESPTHPLYYNELNDKRIRSAADKTLRAKGYQPAEGNTELVIHYHIIVESKSVVKAEPSGIRYSPYWMEKQLFTMQYDEGTLIFDLMDPKTNSLIWRGWAVGVLDDIKPEKIETIIGRTVERIFKKLPASNDRTKLDPQQPTKF